MARDDEGQPDKKLKVKTTVVFEFSHIKSGSGGDIGGGVGGGGGGFGSSIGVGSQVDGGGTVTDVTGTTVTVEFPGGVPEGPIRLPGIDTTVVVEQSGSQEDAGIVIAPWSTGDTLTSSSSAIGPEGGVVTADGLHKSFRLPTPGGEGNYFLLPGDFFPLILNPTNSGTCACAIFIASIDANGKILGPHVMLKPGKSVPIYEAEEGAVSIVAASSGGCINTFDCFSELTVSLGVA